MWDLPGPGIEPVSAVLAGGPFTTGPLGKAPHSRCTRRIVPAELVQSFLRGLEGGSAIWLISFLLLDVQVVSNLWLRHVMQQHITSRTRPSSLTPVSEASDFRKQIAATRRWEHRLGIAQTWVRTPVVPLSAWLHLPRDVAEAQERMKGREEG